MAEFDKPDPAVLQRAIQFQLFIGFGAEAKQLMQAFPTAYRRCGKAWQIWWMVVPIRLLPLSGRRLATVRQRSGPFWRSHSWTPASRSTPTPRFWRSQPAHGLRRDLGPVLADRFMAIGADDAAARVRDAILRAWWAALTPHFSPPKSRCTKAMPAAPTLQQVITDPGPGTAAALVALVEAPRR